MEYVLIGTGLWFAFWIIFFWRMWNRPVRRPPAPPPGWTRRVDDRHRVLK